MIAINIDVTKIIHHVGNYPEAPPLRLPVRRRCGGWCVRGMCRSEYLPKKRFRLDSLSPIARCSVTNASLSPHEQILIMYDFFTPFPGRMAIRIRDIIGML